MIGSALSLELRTLVRSSGRLAALVVFLGVGVVSVLAGRSDVEQWRATIEAGQAEEEERLTEARDYFAAGLKGPEERPWIDLTQPRWQDSYAATRVARVPGPLAGIAFAAAEGRSGRSAIRGCTGR